MTKIIYILITISLLSCQRPDSAFDRTIIVVENQKFEILTANKIFHDFLTSKSDYISHVYRPIEQEFKDNAAFPFLIEILKTKMVPDSRLKEEMAIFRNIDFEQIVESAFQRVVDKLPDPDTKILFVPANPNYKEFWETYGVAIHAFTPGAGKIIVMINPALENWQDLLPLFFM